MSAPVSLLHQLRARRPIGTGAFQWRTAKFSDAQIAEALRKTGGSPTMCAGKIKAQVTCCGAFAALRDIEVRARVTKRRSPAAGVNDRFGQEERFPLPNLSGSCGFG
jgi:hypothetical protein